MLIKIVTLILSTLMSILNIASANQNDVAFNKVDVPAADAVQYADMAVSAVGDAQDINVAPEAEKPANYDVLKMYYAKYEECLRNREIYTEDSFASLESIANSIDWDLTVPDDEEDEYPDNQITVDVTALRLLNAIHSLQYETFTLTFHANTGVDTDDIVMHITYGEETAKIIPDKPTNVGYVFRGWYDDNGTFKHLHNFGKMAGNCDIYAKWELAADSNTVNLMIVSGAMRYKVNGKLQDSDTAILMKDFPIGTRISLQALSNDNGIFLYWCDQNDRIVSFDEEYEFIVKTDIFLRAHYTVKDDNYCRVIFVDRDNKLVASKYVKSGTAVEAPKVSSNYHTGYVFDHWDRDLTCVTEPMIVRAVYYKKNVQYSITVNGGTVEEKSDNDMYSYDEKITVKAEDCTEDGKFFVGWSDDGGNTIISDKAVYSFYAYKDVVLDAIYDTVSTEPEAFITIKGEVLSGGKIRFMTERSLPDGYSLLESGIMVTTNENTVSEGKLNLDMLDSHSDIRLRKTVDCSPDGQYAAVISPTAGRSYYAVGYMVYCDVAGIVHTDYTEVANLTVA